MKIDVIIPLKSTSTNTLGNIKKFSSFKECEKIIIGDAGISKNMVEELKKIPNLILIDQKNLISQGGSIKELISKVTTEYFVYLHSDVKLPNDWFQIMDEQMNKYDFAECHRKYHYDILDNPTDNRKGKKFRALSGSQMGNTKFVKEAIKDIDDDYLFRYEDQVIAEKVRLNQGRYGIVSETYHIHEVTEKENENISSNFNIKFERIPKQKDLKLFESHIYAIIKYCSPISKVNLWHHDYALSVLKNYGINKKKINQLMLNNKKWYFFHYTYQLRMIFRKVLKIFNLILSNNLKFFHK